MTPLLRPWNAGRTSAGKARVSSGTLQTGQGRNEGAFTSDAGSGVAQWGQLRTAAFNASSRLRFVNHARVAHVIVEAALLRIEGDDDVAEIAGQSADQFRAVAPDVFAERHF